MGRGAGMWGTYVSDVVLHGAAVFGEVFDGARASLVNEKCAIGAGANEQMAAAQEAVVVSTVSLAVPIAHYDNF